MEKIIKTPTTRAVLDILRKCNLRCAMCYHLHDDMESITPVETVKVWIDAAKDRGNDYNDITGGEPTLHPNIEEIIQYGLSKGMKTCIITNGMAPENKTKSILDSGIDGFLVSIHGLEKTHNEITCSPVARKLQERFLNQIKGKTFLRFNCVINQQNETEILEIAKWMSQWEPKIVNFINMNPHNGWNKQKEATKKVIANLRNVQPILEQAIDFLESNGIGVNVRYYPMCRIREDLRRTISNDLQVAWDPAEWDYSITPKTIEKFEQWSVNTSNSIECKTGKCASCDLQWICGGINKAFNEASNGEYIDSQVNTGIVDKKDSYHYRQYNTMTLKNELVKN